MSRFLSPMEGRLALLFALALPLLASAGCVDPNCPDCPAGNDDTVTDDDDASDLLVTVEVQVPYGWEATDIDLYEGASLEDGELVTGHDNVTECEFEIEEVGTYTIWMDNWMGGGQHLFQCKTQTFTITQADNGSVIELDEVWEGTGVCSLTPEGRYGTFDVRSSAGHISIDMMGATATGNTFFSDTRTEDSGYMIEGEIAQDLSWIYYHFERFDGLIFEATLPRMEED